MKKYEQWGWMLTGCTLIKLNWWTYISKSLQLGGSTLRVAIGCGITNDYEVMYVVESKLHPPLSSYTLNRVTNCGDYQWNWVQTKWEHMIEIKLTHSTTKSSLSSEWVGTMQYASLYRLWPAGALTELKDTWVTLSTEKYDSVHNFLLMKSFML